MTTNKFMIALAFLLTIPAGMALIGDWLMRRKK